jgi:hypothetical protein
VAVSDNGRDKCTWPVVIRVGDRQIRRRAQQGVAAGRVSAAGWREPIVNVLEAQPPRDLDPCTRGEHEGAAGATERVRGGSV